MQKPYFAAFSVLNTYKSSHHSVLPPPTQGKRKMSFCSLAGHQGQVVEFQCTIMLPFSPSIHSLPNPLIYSHAEALNNNFNVRFIALISSSCSNSKAQTSDHP